MKSVRGSSRTSRYSGSTTTSWTGPRTPFTLPATTRIRTPRTCSTSGIWPALTSWYLGSIILFVFGRFTQSWKPPMRCRSTFGISWWMIPLPDVIRADDPLVPEAVLVLHPAVQHVRDRFDPAVRMPREARHIFGRVLRPEIVEEKERVEARHLRGAEGPMQMHACPLDGWSSRKDLFDAARSRRGNGVVVGHGDRLLVRRFPLKLAPRFASWARC